MISCSVAFCVLPSATATACIHVHAMKKGRRETNSMRIFINHSSEHHAYPKCHEGILRGDIDSIRPLLTGDQPINMRDCDGNTALALASFCDHTEMVQNLLGKGAHVNAKDTKSQTPLHKACRQGNLEVAELLLDHKADVNRKKCRDETPLMLACARGHHRVVVSLLESGADIHSRDMYDRLPMHWAIKGGSLDVVKKLHSKGASFGKCDKFRKNALLQACKCDRPDILQHILGVDSSGLTKEDSLMRGPMQLAAVKNNPECLRVLLENGLDINIKNSRGKSALMEAAFNGNKESLEYLLSNPECNTDLLDQYGSTALILAIMGRVSFKHMERNKLWFDVIFSLVNANTSLDVLSRSTMFWDRSAHNMHHQNALELALKAGHADTVKLLARAGSNPGNLQIYFKLTTKALPQCIRSNMKLYDWLKRLYKSPRPLTELCRLSIRKHYGTDWLRIAPSLQVAPGVRKYLNFCDMQDLIDAYHVDPEAIKMRREFCGKQDDSGDRSEVEYEPSAYDSDWYGKLDNIVDTESEDEEEDTRTSSNLGAQYPGMSSWYGMEH